VLGRKLFHASGILVVLVYRLVPLERWLAAALLWSLVALLAGIDLLRARSPALQAAFQRWLRLILDKKDEHGWNGSTLYFAGCAIAVTTTSPDAACAGILALALGDPSAAIIGSNLRSPRWGKVSVAGSLACFVAASLGCRIFFGWPLSLAGGAAASLLEAISGSKFDNLVIPVGVALLLALLGAAS